MHLMNKYHSIFFLVIRPVKTQKSQWVKLWHSAPLGPPLPFPPLIGVTLPFCMAAHTACSRVSINKVHSHTHTSLCVYENGFFRLCFSCDFGAVCGFGGGAAAFWSQRRRKAAESMGPNYPVADRPPWEWGERYQMGGVGGGFEWVWELSTSGDVIVK